MASGPAARPGVVTAPGGMSWLERVQQGVFYVFLFMLPISKAAIEISFPILLVTWLMTLAKPGGWHESVWSRPFLRPVLLATGTFLGICALSIVTSSHPELSLRGFVRKTLEYLLFFVVLADFARDVRVVERGLLVLLVSSGIIGLDAIAQEFLGRDLLLGHRMTYHYRMTGPYENPNDLATYLLVVIPVVLAYGFRESARPRWAVWALLVLLFGCLVRTMYLIGLLGLVVGFGLFGWLHRASRRALLIVGVGICLVGIIAQIARGMTWQNFVLLQDNSGTATGLQDRLWMWGAAVKMIQARPWIGVGLNTFMENYLTYWVGGEQMPRYAHNCYLQVAAELGLIGLAAFLWLLATMVSRWSQALRRAGDSPQRLTLIGLSVGLTIFLLQSAIDTNFYALRHAVLFWTLAGLATGLAANVLQRGVKAGASA